MIARQVGERKRRPTPLEVGSRDEPGDSQSGGHGQFDDRPLLVFWETTKACDLACLHCRASAQPEPGLDEISTAEGCELIDELAAIGRPRPILILTGGDCLKRPDIFELVAYARLRSVPVAISPSVSPQFTTKSLEKLRSLGVKTVSLSLDGAAAATHDTVRGIAGHFDDTLRAVARLQRHGYTVQINTTVMAVNLMELADVAVLMHKLGVDVWEVFFLITVGRGTGVVATVPQENEEVCNFLADASRYGFTIRTVEAPFFRRVTAGGHRGAMDGFSSAPIGALHSRLRDRLIRQLGLPTAPVRAPSAATRDGKGIIFIAANGDVYPSGFMPLRLGSIRNQKLVDIYRDHSVLKQIRAAAFSGACGDCDYAQLCGGSRARSFASSGDPLGSDPGGILVADSGVASSK